jgi:positive regulator of sigma E activity
MSSMERRRLVLLVVLLVLLAVLTALGLMPLWGAVLILAGLGTGFLIATRIQRR